MAGSASSARRTSAFCHLCGRRLVGRYYRLGDGLTFCATCHDTRPRCERCAAPLDDPAVRQSGGAEPAVPLLCTRCVRLAPRCAACQRPIASSWYTFEELLPQAEQRHFCEPCVRTRPRCDLCRAPVAPRAVALDDGQYRCAQCAADMPLGDGPVSAVYRDALRAFAGVVGAGPRETPRLAVVTRPRMGEVRRAYEGAGPRDELSATAGHHVLGFFVRSHGASTIYVERALPRPLLLGTLAHELGHAWQAEQAPHERDPLLCEGFAEWAAYRVLVSAGLGAMAERAARRDDLYGRGLRHYLAIERRAALPGVLRTARGR